MHAHPSLVARLFPLAALALTACGTTHEQPPAPDPSAEEPLYVDVAMHGHTLCAVGVRDGVHCWIEGAPSILPGTIGASDVEVGDDHACVVGIDGRVACFDVSSGGPRSIEVASIDGARGLSVGADYACAIAEDDRMHCFSLHARYEVGVVLDDVYEVACAADRACALLGDGTTTCFDVGSIPSEGRLQGALDLASARGRILAVRTDGSVVAIEASGAFDVRAVATVPGGVEVGGSESASCVRSADRTVTCVVEGREPALVPSLDGAATLAMGDGAVCAILGGALHCASLTGEGPPLPSAI